MSPAEVYERFAIEFPPVHPEDHAWVNIHDGQKLKLDALSTLLARHIKGNDTIVLIHSEPGIGAELPLPHVATFIAPYLLKAEIQVANLNLGSFVAINRYGTATGWCEAEK